MISRSLQCVLAAAVFLPAAALAQPVQVKDPADLFPPDSLLYAEVTKPAELSRDVAAFIKGSVVEDMTQFMSKWREKKGDGYFMAAEMMAMMSAFAGPEALAEFKRMQGAAVAVTGVNKKNDPEFVFVLLAGDSNVPNFIMRMFMTVDFSLRSAGTVEGVPMFYEVPRGFNRVGPGAPAPPPMPQEITGPIYANPPGAVIVGSSVEATTDLIKRMKGKEKRLALSGAPGFREAAALRQRPGLFAFANPGRILETVETYLKGDDAFPPIARRLVAELVNPKAMRYAAASLTLIDGSLDLQLAVQTEAGNSSPLIDFIADHKVALPMMQASPKESIGLVTFALNDGEKKFNQLLAMAEKIVGDDGPKPSEQIKAIEGQLKASIGKDIFGRISAVTVTLPAHQELPKGAMEIPMLIVTGVDAAAAEKLEQLVPPVLGMIAGDLIEPITETIQGQKVRSLPGKAFPWKAALHYGRSGPSLVFGLDRKLVAAAMAGKPTDSILSDTKLTEAIKPHENSAVVGFYRWGNLLPDWFAVMGHERRWVNGKFEEPDQAKIKEKSDKLRKSMAGLLQELPPLVVSLSRKSDGVVLNVRQRQQPGASAKIIDGLLDAVMSSATNVFEQMGNAAAPAPPPPPIKN
jgi:hypothetical protein